MKLKLKTSKMNNLILKAIEINGFKSFGNPTKIGIFSGLNVILGPAGTGKSNLLNAIRWALSDLEGEEDSIIFNGTKEKKSAGYAEVTLVYGNIENTESDILISRHIDSDGKELFSINDSKSDKLSDFRKSIKTFNIPELCLLDDFDEGVTDTNPDIIVRDLKNKMKDLQTLVVLKRKDVVKMLTPDSLIGITCLDSGISRVTNINIL